MLLSSILLPFCLMLLVLLCLSSSLPILAKIHLRRFETDAAHGPFFTCIAVFVLVETSEDSNCGFLSTAMYASIILSSSTLKEFRDASASLCLLPELWVEVTAGMADRGGPSTAQCRRFHIETFKLSFKPEALIWNSDPSCRNGIPANA